MMLVRALGGELDAVDLIEEADQFLEPFRSDRLPELGVGRKFLGGLGTPRRAILDDHRLADRVRQSDQPLARRRIGPIVGRAITPLEASSTSSQPPPEKPGEEHASQDE